MKINAENAGAKRPTTGDGDRAEAMDTSDQDMTLQRINGDQHVDTKMEEDGSDDDDSRAEATFRFTISKFSQMRESTLSPPCMVRNLPWKILAMPRPSNSDPSVKCLGFFLQCNAESDSTNEPCFRTWTCSASAELRLLHRLDPEKHYVKKIHHVFFHKENDWGFAHFKTMKEIVEASNGFCDPVKDSITLEVWVNADAPHGVQWDSKRHTGYVGLKNQGATCYMNSLLQTLFFTNKLRKAVYKMPTDCDDMTKSVPLALQRVFYELQNSEKPVGTKKLTKSFGWETLDTFMQHDVQELCRVLLDNIESKMKGTVVEGTIPTLFEGKMISYVKCKHVNYVSSRTEPFYDVQLNVKDKKNIYESFKDYVSVETLDGDNKYDAGDYGLQEAEKGVKFVSFPPVLHLHLMRFQYDPISDCNVKINDRFEFPEHLELDDFLEQKESTPAHYTLHAVLVHSGDNHGGHYVVFINPRVDGKVSGGQDGDHCVQWCKFDDDVVSRCTKKDAIDNNFGGDSDDVASRTCTNAYMLVYIRDSDKDDVLQAVEAADIPESLVARLMDEKRLEAIRKRERQEAHLYMTLNVVSEEEFYRHQHFDLCNIEKAEVKQFQVKKNTFLRDFPETVCRAFKCSSGQARLWLFHIRSNNTIRVKHVDSAMLDKTLRDIAEASDQNIFFLAEMPCGTATALQQYDPDSDVLVLFKYYDPKGRCLTYVGHVFAKLKEPLSHLFPEMRRRAGLPADAELLVHEEVCPGSVNVLADHDKALEAALDSPDDGDILVFQLPPSPRVLHLPTAADYFNDLTQRTEVTFIDRNSNSDHGVTLELSEKTTYSQVAAAVAECLGTQPEMLQFFRPKSYHTTFRESPDQPLKSTFDGTLKDLFLYFHKTRTPKKMFYQRLKIPIKELESKAVFKCVYVDASYKEEKELVVYPNQNGSVADLCTEVKSQLELRDGARLRLLEISNHRITTVFRDDSELRNISSNFSTTRSYRVEELPEDQIEIGPNETLLPVAHFHREPYSCFGIPFLLKIKNGEPFSEVKVRIQKMLDVPEKEYEKWKFAVVFHTRAEYIDNESLSVNLEQLRSPVIGVHLQTRPWLGLDHVNKSTKSRPKAFTEKAIKIHN